MALLIGGSTIEGSTRRTLGLEAKATADVNSEHGVGALMPWAGKLYVQTYLSASNPIAGTANTDNGLNGAGSGLFSVDRQRRVTVEHYDGGCNPGRMIHRETKQLIIGSCVVSAAGQVTPIPAFQPGGAFAGQRVAAYCRHLTTPATHVHAWTMNGILYSVNMTTLAVTTDSSSAVTDLGIGAEIPHGKSCWKGAYGGGRIYVTFNNDGSNGRLAQWNGSAWSTMDSCAYIDIGGSYGDSNYAFAHGHDERSVVLQILDPANGVPRKLRLPYGGDSWQMYFQQEWQRCRQVESERFLMDAYGLWWDMSPFLWGTTFATSMPRIRAIGAHSRIVPDFCYWDGSLVLGGNHQSAVYSNYIDSGQSSGGLLFTDGIDELRRIPPTGYGYWWKDDTVSAGQAAIPMCAAGMGQASMHFINSGATSTEITISARLREKSFLLDTVTVAAGEYASYIPPAGFRCDWFSIASSAATTLTARVDFG